jgi:hypothetical protein
VETSTTEPVGRIQERGSTDARMGRRARPGTPPVKDRTGFGHGHHKAHARDRRPGVERLDLLRKKKGNTLVDPCLRIEETAQPNFGGLSYRPAGQSYIGPNCDCLGPLISFQKTSARVCRRRLASPVRRGLRMRSRWRRRRRRCLRRGSVVLLSGCRCRCRLRVPLVRVSTNCLDSTHRRQCEDAFISRPPQPGYTAFRPRDDPE